MTRASNIENASLPPLFADTPLISDTDLVKGSALPASVLKPAIARHSGLIITLLADGHAAANRTDAVLKQGSGAALHWRFRAKP